MSDQSNDAAKRLGFMLDALQESLLETSLEDLVKELRAAGVDPLKTMSLMEFAGEKAIAEHYQRLRERLTAERTESVKRIGRAADRLPQSRDERIDLLQAICKKNSLQLTAQFRDLKDIEKLSDDELSNMLQQLAVLGLLSPDSGNGG